MKNIVCFIVIILSLNACNKTSDKTVILKILPFFSRRQTIFIILHLLILLI